MLGQRRKRTRISGIVVSTCARDMELNTGYDQGPAFRTRSSKKRKKNASQGEEQASKKEHPPESDQSHLRQQSNSPDSVSRSYVVSASEMPEKRILELILDILQRTDIHEIFAEPVDPSKVEHYHEVIKEPMDFGTMRAKLHEGMYKSLEQFEHDAFLISRNAMHFNSSGSVYFKQARLLQELAEKVFHVLKTEPENFEREFSETRQRACRRLRLEARLSPHTSSQKSAAPRSSKMTVCGSSKASPCSLSGSSTSRRSTQPKAEHFRSPANSNSKDHKSHCRMRDGRRYNISEADRRHTYRQLNSVSYENHATALTVNNTKTLFLVKQQHVGYEKSIMMFVKDFGPAVQMIAKRKLCGLSGSACSAHTSIFFQNQQVPSTPDKSPAAAASLRLLEFPRWSASTLENRHRINLDDSGKGKKAHNDDLVKIPDVSAVEPPKSNGNMWEESGTDLNFSVSKYRLIGNASTTMMLGKVKFEDRAQSSVSSLENSEPEEKYGVPLSSWPPQYKVASNCSPTTMIGLHSIHKRKGNCTVAEQAANSLCSFEAGQALKSSQTRFALNMPYLSKGLDGINSLGKDISICSDFEKSPSEEDSLLKKRSNQRGLSCNHRGRKKWMRNNRNGGAFSTQKDTLALGL